MCVSSIRKCIAHEQVPCVEYTKFRFLDYINDFGKMAPRLVIESQNKQIKSKSLFILNCFEKLLYSHKQFLK